MTNCETFLLNVLNAFIQAACIIVVEAKISKLHNLKITLELFFLIYVNSPFNNPLQVSNE